MDSTIEQLFNEAIRMERYVAALYRLYQKRFPEERALWDQLVLEEENHAAIIQSGRDYFFEEGLFPLEALDADLRQVQAINRSIQATIAAFRETPPELADALRRALEFESSSVEHYYQYVLQLPPESNAVVLFQELSNQSDSHERKILELMRKHGVPAE
jgi:rubrerythrin